MSVPVPFGVMPDGTAVEKYTLNAGALSCDIITYGGAIQALRAPDRNGRLVDVVLGCGRLEDYLSQDKFFGALVGRFANRVGGARFTLNGVTHQLAANDHEVNHLHGGPLGFARQVWKVEAASENSLVLSLFSPDGQENYPGNLNVQVTYTLSEAGLTIDYLAQSGQDTVCNLTNHAYFNLAGHDSGPVLDQTIQIMADSYTPTDALSIPTGKIDPVAGTPMDLRNPSLIGAQIDAQFEQLQFAGGYDHNWVLNGTSGALRTAARASSSTTGISLEVLTTLPGVQFYTGNFLDGTPAGKNGAVYNKRCGFCLETQFFPDTPNHDNFPSCTLRAGEIWKHTTVFHFAVQ